jgi:hypothetical protein
MNYYVGIRESMIDRARQASSSTLHGNSVAQSLRTPEKTQQSKEKGLASAMQTLISA